MGVGVRASKAAKSSGPMKATGGAAEARSFIEPSMKRLLWGRGILCRGTMMGSGRLYWRVLF